MDGHPEIESSVDHERHRVSTTWQGSIDLDLVTQNCERRIQQGAHSYTQLIDATKASIAHTPSDAQQAGFLIGNILKKSQSHGPLGNTAVVVHSSLDYGMCRVIASYFEPGGEIRVFYNLPGAREYLGWT